MDARSTTLAALAAVPDRTLTRVQSQKLLFLIDRQLADHLGGRAFMFIPYHYGPYDKSVYRTLEQLVADGLVDVKPVGPTHSYRLTPRGEIAALAALDSMPAEAAAHIKRLAAWVRSLSFSELVKAIYRAYPEMLANSIFQR